MGGDRADSLPVGFCQTSRPSFPQGELPAPQRFSKKAFSITLAAAGLGLDLGLGLGIPLGDHWGSEPAYQRVPGLFYLPQVMLD